MEGWNGEGEDQVPAVISVYLILVAWLLFLHYGIRTEFA